MEGKDRCAYPQQCQSGWKEMLVPGPDHDYADYASMQPFHRLAGESLAGLQAREALRRRQLRRALMRSPRTVVEVLIRLTRLSAALALTAPVFCATMLAWWEGGQINLLALGLNVLATLTLAMGVHALGEYRDYRRALAAHATSDADPLFSGYGVLGRGFVDGSIAHNLGYILLAISVLCGLWLPIIVGWPPLFFAGLSVLLVYFYANPPLQYGVRGWGLGEFGLFVSFGLLQTLNSYYVQSEGISWRALMICVPMGLLCVLIQHNYNLVFERRDWLLRKRTLAVSLGALRALDVSALLTVLVHVTIVAIVSLAQLPFSTLLTLVALPIALGAFSRIDRDRLAMEDLFQVYKAGVNSTIWTGLLFCLALISATLW
jgi:1,4-dihydroxy-2-naphthoate octaprenyltransferase